MRRPEGRRPQRPAKERYRPPRLTLYGTIVELTGASFTPNGILDGGAVTTKMGLAFLKSG